MTMMIHTAVPAPVRPQIRITFGFFSKMAKIIAQAHCHSRGAQNLLRAHDAMLKDIGYSRIVVNGNAYLFAHRN